MDNDRMAPNSPLPDAAIRRVAAAVPGAAAADIEPRGHLAGPEAEAARDAACYARVRAAEVCARAHAALAAREHSGMGAVARPVLHSADGACHLVTAVGGHKPRARYTLAYLRVLA